jgi:hypothetical protein
MFSFKHETSPGHNNNFYKINTGEWKTSNLFFLIAMEDEEKTNKTCEPESFVQSVSKANCKRHFMSQSQMLRS